MRRSLIACLSLALLLAAVPAAHAQLGGLKKKVADKVAGKKPDTTATVAAKPKCDNSSMVISSDVVDRYLKSLAARDAEMQKLAKEPGQTGAFYSAVLKRQAVERRQAEYELHRGPDWEKNQALQKRLMTGDASAVQEQTALSQSINPHAVEVPELEWEAQQKGSVRIDSVMRVAGRFSECDWLNVGTERLPRLIYILVADPETKDLQGFGTPQEAAVIRPRVAELARAMNIKYVSPEDKARLKAEEEEAKRLAQQPTSTGNPQTDCMVKVQMEFAKAHQKEFEAAQKSQDVNATMKLSQQLGLEMAKCKAPGQ
jgi:hypothetical protein